MNIWQRIVFWFTGNYPRRIHLTLREATALQNKALGYMYNQEDLDNAVEAIDSQVEDIIS